MYVDEHYIQGKNSKCEDGLFISENFIVIVDGVTSKGQKTYNGKSSGEYAKDLIIRYFETARADISKENLFCELNNLLYENYKNEHNISIEDYLRAAVLVYSKEYKEIWRVGDCQFMINNHLYENPQHGDNILSEVRSAVIRSSLAKGITETEIMKHDIGREAIKQALIAKQIFENCNDKWGYQVINGQKLPLDSIKSFKVQKGDCVVMASDGYPKLFESLKESEDYLKEVLTRDPLAYKEYKCTKGLQDGNVSFDDRTYVKFYID